MGLLDNWYAVKAGGELLGLDRVDRARAPKPLKGDAAEFQRAFDEGRCVEIERPRDHETGRKRVELTVRSDGDWLQAWPAKHDQTDVLFRQYRYGEEKWFKLTPPEAPKWAPAASQRSGW